MKTKRKLILLSQQNMPDETQQNGILQTSLIPTSNNETTPCRLEYLKKLYYFKLTEDDNKQVPDPGSNYSDQDTDILTRTGMHGNDFCDKYCVEKSVCSGRVIILFPKSDNTLSGNDPNRSTDIIVPVPKPDPFQQNLYWLWSDGDVKRALLPGEHLFLKNTLTFIETCYKDYKFSVDLLAMQLNMSVSQANRKLNSLTGHPAGYLIRLFRLQRAATYLLDGEKNVSEICFNTGFNSLSYFCRSFKKQFGCSPSQYKKALAEKLYIMRQKDN